MKQQLEKIIGLEVLESEDLSQYTTFKIGGPAKFFVVVRTKQQLLKALQAVRELELPYLIMGGGSNMLVSDAGFDGLVINMRADEPEFEDNGRVTVFAGMNLGALIRESVEKELAGLEFAANIPGTVGGAIYGNAGAYGKGVGDLVEFIEVVNFGENEISLKVMTPEECKFAYRESTFKENKNWIISEVKFLLTKDEAVVGRLKELEEEWYRRTCTQPLNKPSAGCSFKNVLYSDDLSKYKEWEIKGKLPAARFIEGAELKGHKVGGAMVSDVHANFILNNDNATASDVAELISFVKTQVKEKYGVELEEEVQYVGF